MALSNCSLLKIILDATVGGGRDRSSETDKEVVRLVQARYGGGLG